MDDPDDESVPVRRRGMRTGFTTGACATAAALAATRYLMSGTAIRSVTIHLPAGDDATFPIANCTLKLGRVRCSVIKDAGDDPDVTHGAEIVARVWRSSHPGIELRGGTGVGTVTLPGLGLAVGGPAINPVPRGMIVEAVTEAAGSGIESKGLVVEISVPKGEELAKKTLNARLGIIGGISILGTTGIVRPYSTASWRASVEQAIDVAAANGHLEIAITTGGRSERFAQKELKLPDIAMIEMGEFTGHALRRATHDAIRTVHVCGMIGKLSKVAQGHLMTHVAGNQVDTGYLASVANRAGASDGVWRRMATANTAREAQELAQTAGLTGFFDLIADEASAVCSRYVRGALAIDCLLFDFDGTLLGRSSMSRVRGEKP
jgi:cobalt-precorrin-5B (C1)-methyltransferase